MESTTATLGNVKLTNRTADRSPRATTRLAGLLYLVITIAAIVAHVYVPSRLLVSGDAAGLLFFPNYGTTPVLLALLIGIAEVAFPLWLLIKGVDVEQWNKRALAAG